MKARAEHRTWALDWCWSRTLRGAVTVGMLITWTVKGSNLGPLGLAFSRVLAASVCLAVALSVTPGGRKLLRVPRRRTTLARRSRCACGGRFSSSLGPECHHERCVAGHSGSVQCAHHRHGSGSHPLARAVDLAQMGRDRPGVPGHCPHRTIPLRAARQRGQSKLTPLGLLISLGTALTYAGITLFTKKLRDDAR